MPCNCDHLEPNTHEQESKLVCQLLVYVLSSLNRIPEIQQWMCLGADNIYGNRDKLYEGTVILCSLCTGMIEGEKNAIMYNGRISEARLLAEWWDEHEKADKARIAMEAAKKDKQKLLKTALSKLTAAELQALRELA